MSAFDTVVAVHESSARSDATYATAVDTSSVASGAAPRERRLFAPGELVSLWDMLRFDAQPFVALMGILRVMDMSAASIARTYPPLRRTAEAVNDLLASDGGTEEEKQYRAWLQKTWSATCINWEKLLEAMERYCIELQLEFARLMAERIREQLKANSQLRNMDQWDTFSVHFAELGNRVEDELKARLIFAVPSDRASYFSDSPPFGDAVAKKFPRLTEDIAEASKCLCFGRFTAAVFHLMRVMETGVRIVAKRLGVSVNLEQPWGSILKPIDAAIAALPGGPAATPPENTRKAAFSEAAVFLRHVKDAWRNKTMHPKRTYTEEEALRVFEVCKSFMQQLVKLR